MRRAADPADWTEAAALLHDYADWIRTEAGFEPFREQPSFAEELDGLAEHYGRSGTALFIAYRKRLAVGTVAVSCHAGDAAELKRMYVRPAARGHGVADTLIARAVAFAERRRCHHVRLESVRGPMDPAIAVYRRNGFTIVDDEVPTITVADVVVMRRPLR